MKRLCVFCGSNFGNDPEFKQAAEKLGQSIASQQLGLVYGGGNVGLMGVVAESVLSNGGEVIGVIPEFMVKKELAKYNLTDLRVVNTMHERKALMAELSDGFIALPGGIGTFEEFFEVFTWAQLGVHNKSCSLLNVNNYYTKLIDFLKDVVSNGFVSEEHFNMVLVDHDPDNLIQRILNFKPIHIEKLIDQDKM